MKIRNNNEMIIYLLIGNAAHASFILWYTLDACTTLKYAFVSSRGKKIKHNDRVSLQLNHHHPSMDHGCFFCFWSLRATAPADSKSAAEQMNNDF